MSSRFVGRRVARRIERQRARVGARRVVEPPLQVVLDTDPVMVGGVGAGLGGRRRGRADDHRNDAAHARGGRASSEVELDPELHDAGRRGGQDLAEAARLAGDVRRAEVRVVEGVEHLPAELDPPPVAGREVLGQREVERRQAGPAHDADAGGPEGLRRRAEGRERVRVEPSGDRPLRFRQLGLADEVGPGPSFAADAEHRRAAKRRRQAEPALHGVDAGQLPAAEQGIGQRRPVVAVAAAPAERQLPDVARHEAMLDVELGQAALGLQVVAVLRLTERAGVESGPTPARRDVVRRLGQRLAPGVADERAEPVREPLLEPGLERVVAGVDAVLHPLDVAEAGDTAAGQPTGSRSGW